MKRWNYTRISKLSSEACITALSNRYLIFLWHPYLHAPFSATLDIDLHNLFPQLVSTTCSRISRIGSLPLIPTQVQECQHLPIVYIRSITISRWYTYMWKTLAPHPSASFFCNPYILPLRLVPFDGWGGKTSRYYLYPPHRCKYISCERTLSFR